MFCGIGGIVCLLAGIYAGYSLPKEKDNLKQVDLSFMFLILLGTGLFLLLISSGGMH